MCEKAKHNADVLKTLAEKLLPDLEKMVEKSGIKSVRIKRTGKFPLAWGLVVFFRNRK